MSTIEKLKNFEGDLIVENKRLRVLLQALADAADDVGVHFFDTDDMPAFVEIMQAAILAARAALK